MRVAGAVVLLLLGALAGAFFFFTKPMPEPPKRAGPDFTVELSRPGVRAAELEREIVPFEATLQAAHATHVRSRIRPGKATVEVWGAQPGSLPPGATMGKAHPQRYWLVQGEQRPKGAVCGREEPLLQVRLDPLKLAALNVSALDIDRLVTRLPLEELRKLPITDQARLEDLAVLELSAPAPRCRAEAEGGPAWLVDAEDAEGAGGTRLVRRLALRWPVDRLPRLGPVRPALTTFEAPSAVTLWFSEPFDPAQTVSALQRENPDLLVTHVDGWRRVRLVFSGSDRELLSGIAGTVVETLKLAKGVQLVVAPLPPEPYVDVKVDRERAAPLGIAAEDIAALSALAMRGSEHDGVRVSVDLSEREHLAALFIGGRRLGELVTMSEELEPAELLREDGQPAVEIFAYGIDAKGVPMPALPGGVTLEIDEEL